jgi:hypothetical protein
MRKTARLLCISFILEDEEIFENIPVCREQMDQTAPAGPKGAFGAALFFSFREQQHHNVNRRQHPCIRIERKPCVDDIGPTASIICEYFGEYGELG